MCLAATLACAPTYDVIIRNGDVIDGTGSPPRRVDLAITNGRIAAIGTVTGRAREEIDASGRVVAPGFIDVQGQSGTTLLASGNGESHIRQGITTEIIGEGNTPALWTKENADEASIQRLKLAFDWTGFDGYLRALEKKGTSINLGSLVPVAMLREQVMGMADRPATRRRSSARSRSSACDAARCVRIRHRADLSAASYTNTAELIALAKVAAVTASTSRTCVARAFGRKGGDRREPSASAKRPICRS